MTRCTVDSLEYICSFLDYENELWDFGTAMLRKKRFVWPILFLFFSFCLPSRCRRCCRRMIPEWLKYCEQILLESLIVKQNLFINLKKQNNSIPWPTLLVNVRTCVKSGKCQDNTWKWLKYPQSFFFFFKIVI